MLIRALILLLLPMTTAAHHTEKFYQETNCQGKTEEVLHDLTRVDCLTETHAIEYDWGNKWAEAIGQSLGYAVETGKKPGIVLILKTPKHEKYWRKLNRVIDRSCYQIDLWRIEAW